MPLLDPASFGTRYVSPDASLGGMLSGTAAPSFMDKLAQTWPARLAKDAFAALTLPGDVYQGKVSMWGEDGRTNPEVINRSADLTGLLASGGLPIAERGVAGALGGKLAHVADNADLPSIAPRVVSNPKLQEYWLRKNWEAHGPDLDYDFGNWKAWDREVKLWNKANPDAQIPSDNYQFGSNKAFEQQFTNKYLNGRKEAFPGPKKANQYFEDRGDVGAGVYVAGKVPESIARLLSEK